MRLTIFSLIIFMFFPAKGQENNNYEQLHEFFYLWRDFENNPLRVWKNTRIVRIITISEAI